MRSKNVSNLENYLKIIESDIFGFINYAVDKIKQSKQVIVSGCYRLQIEQIYEEAYKIADWFKYLNGMHMLTESITKLKAQMDIFENCDQTVPPDILETIRIVASSSFFIYSDAVHKFMRLLAKMLNRELFLDLTNESKWNSELISCILGSENTEKDILQIISASIGNDRDLREYFESVLKYPLPLPNEFKFNDPISKLFGL